MSRWLSLAVQFFVSLSLIWGIWAYLGRPQALSEPDIPLGRRLQCVSYTPLEKHETPWDIAFGKAPSPDHMAADLELLAQRFTCIRTYAATGLDELLPLAEQYGLKVLLGAWVNGDPEATRRELRQVVALATRHRGVVRAVVVGNEALLRKEVSDRQLVAYIEEVRRTLPPDIPVTYADVWEFWLSHPKIAPAVDFVTIHILPYWENDPTSIEDAEAHVNKIYTRMARKFPGKKLLIGEMGWPSAGRMREGARPSRANQARFIRGAVALAEREGWSYSLIEAFDQPWKRGNEGAVGGYWGLYDANRRDKGNFFGPVSHDPDWKRHFAQSAGVFLIAYLVLWRVSVSSWKRRAVASASAVAVSCLWVLQTAQFFSEVRDGREASFAVFLLLLAAGSYAVWLAAFLKKRWEPPAALSEVVDRLRSPRFFFSLRGASGLLRLFAVFSALCVLLGLLFDPRYRSFPVFGFAIPALAFFSIYWRTRGSGVGQTEGVTQFLGAVLILGAFGVGLQEGPRNLQADAWVGICVGLGLPLLAAFNWGDVRAALRAMGERGDVRRAVCAVLFACLAAFLIRYHFLEPAALASECAEAGAPSWCRLREWIGIGIYFEVAPRIGLLAAIGSFFSQKVWLTALAVAMGLVGLTLYTVGPASLVLVLACIASMQGRVSNSLGKCVQQLR